MLPIFWDYPVVAPATQAYHRLRLNYPFGIKGSFAEVSYGTRRFFFEFPGTEVPGYFHSFLRNDPKCDFCRGLLTTGYGPGKASACP